jgi:O-antigen/teichoic acid export membrane protein
MITQYRALNVKARAALWFTICNFLNKGISMIVVPLYTRLLSMEEYSSYTLFQSWMNILTILATLQISQAYFNVGITKYDDDVDAYTSSMMGLGNAVTLLVFLVYLCAIPLFDEWLTLSTPVVTGMLLFLFVSPAWEFWAIRQRFNYNYGKMVVATLFVAVLGPVLGIVGILKFNLHSEAAIFSKLMVQGVLAVFIYVQFIRKGRRVYHRKYWKEGFTYGITLMPYLLSMIVLDQADRIMIRNLIGPTEAAIYSVAYSAAMILQLVNNAIDDALVPWIYQKLKGKRYGDIEPVTNKLLILVAASNLLLILFAPEVIAFFAPSTYMDAIWVIPPITASVFFMFLFQRYINVEVYYGATVNISKTSIGVAALNIALNFIFIPMFGYYAAGYTTLFCYIAFCASHYFALRKICKERCEGEQIFTAKSAVIAGCLYLACIFALTFLYEYRVPRYLFALLMCLYGYRQREFIFSLMKNRRKSKESPERVVDV